MHMCSMWIPVSSKWDWTPLGKAAGTDRLKILCCMLWATCLVEMPLLIAGIHHYSSIIAGRLHYLAFKRSLSNQTILWCYECLLLTLGQEEGMSLLSATENHVQTPSEGKLNPRAAQLLPDLLRSALLLPSCRHCESGGFLGRDPQHQSKKTQVQGWSLPS